MARQSIRRRIRDVSRVSGAAVLLLGAASGVITVSVLDLLSDLTRGLFSHWSLTNVAAAVVGSALGFLHAIILKSARRSGYAIGVVLGLMTFIIIQIPVVGFAIQIPPTTLLAANILFGITFATLFDWLSIRPIFPLPLTGPAASSDGVVAKPARERQDFLNPVANRS